MKFGSASNPAVAAERSRGCSQCRLQQECTHDPVNHGRVVLSAQLLLCSRCSVFYGLRKIGRVASLGASKRFHPRDTKELGRGEHFQRYAAKAVHVCFDGAKGAREQCLGGKETGAADEVAENARVGRQKCAKVEIAYFHHNLVLGQVHENVLWLEVSAMGIVRSSGGWKQVSTSKLCGKRVHCRECRTMHRSLTCVQHGGSRGI